MLQLKSAIFVIILAGLLSSCGKKDEGENPRTPKQYTIEQLANNLSVSATGFSTDESKVLVSNNSSGIFNVYELNVADTTSMALTSSKKNHFLPLITYREVKTTFILLTKAAMKMHIFI